MLLKIVVLNAAVGLDEPGVLYDYIPAESLVVNLRGM
jgi:hypothetical protein